MCLNVGAMEFYFLKILIAAAQKSEHLQLKQKKRVNAELNVNPVSLLQQNFSTLLN